MVFLSLDEVAGVVLKYKLEGVQELFSNHFPNRKHHSVENKSSGQIKLPLICSSTADREREITPEFGI